MVKWIYKFALILSVGALSACAGLTKQKDQAAIQNIKKVAIVSFAVYQPDTATVSLTNGKLEGDVGGSMLPEKSAHIEKIYSNLSSTLNKNLKWTVIEQSKMTAAPGYQAAYKKTMEGWQNKMPPGEGQVLFLAEKVMDHDSLRILDDAGRQQLIKDLGVDAIIEATVNVSLSGTSIAGIGKRYPVARLFMRTFAAGKEAPIWFETFEGEKAQESVGMTGFINLDKLNELTVQSSQSAFGKIL